MAFLKSTKVEEGSFWSLEKKAKDSSIDNTNNSFKYDANIKFLGQSEAPK